MSLKFLFQQRCNRCGCVDDPLTCVHFVRNKKAFTLVELLVVIAIIGVLIGLLIPAVQAARESGRRVSCQNNLKELALATQQYVSVNDSFPPGFVYKESSGVIEGPFWSAYLLPYLEEDMLFETLDFSQAWSTGHPNAKACGTHISSFRCPSALAEPHMNIQGIDHRIPATYLACASGVVDKESGSDPRVSNFDLDGVLYNFSHTKISEISDGTSKTVALGEAIFDIDVRGIDHGGTIHIVDHWHIGSPSIHSTDVSECLATTAVPINVVFDEDAFIDAKELCFSSRHGAGAQISFADGHVEMISSNIAPDVWSHMGTRNNVGE